MAHGHVTWTELMTWDVEKAKAFYGRHMGWTFFMMEMESGDYWIANDGDEQVAGLFELNEADNAGTPEHWFTYFDVSDVDASVAAAAADGAEILQPPFDVPGVGRIAVVKSPTGSVSGWMTPASS